MSSDSLIELFDEKVLKGEIPNPKYPNDLLVAKSIIIYNLELPVSSNVEYQGVISVGKSSSKGMYPGETVYKVVRYSGNTNKIRPIKHNEKMHEFKNLKDAVWALNKLLQEKTRNKMSSPGYKAKPINGAVPSCNLLVSNVLIKAKENLQLNLS